MCSLSFVSRGTVRNRAENFVASPDSTKLPMGLNTDTRDFESPGQAERVQIDALVVLKIIKHCRTSFPSAVTGQLLGMAFDDTLQVTNSFAFPGGQVADDATMPKSKANQKYMQEMMRSLKEVNVDANAVGWYQSAYLGSFVTKEVIETQMQSQQYADQNNVFLVYDVSRSTQGVLSLHAFRLSDSFVKAYRDGGNSGRIIAESLAQNHLNPSTIFEELPITIHHSHLLSSFLHNVPVQPSYDDLDLSIDPYLEKNVEYMLDSVDDYNYELGNWGYWQRQVGREQSKIQGWISKRKAENATRQTLNQPLLPEDEWTRLFKMPTEPSRLDGLLAAGQIGIYFPDSQYTNSQSNTASR